MLVVIGLRSGFDEDVLITGQDVLSLGLAGERLYGNALFGLPKGHTNVHKLVRYEKSTTVPWWFLENID